MVGRLDLAPNIEFVTVHGDRRTVKDRSQETAHFCCESGIERSISEIELVLNGCDAGLGAGVVGISTGRSGDTDRADHRAAGLNHDAATENHHARQVAKAGLRRTGLGQSNEFGRVGSEADGGPGTLCPPRSLAYADRQSDRATSPA